MQSRKEATFSWTQLQRMCTHEHVCTCTPMHTNTHACAGTDAHTTPEGCSEFHERLTLENEWDRSLNNQMRLFFLITESNWEIMESACGVLRKPAAQQESRNSIEHSGSSYEKK